MKKLLGVIIFLLVGGVVAFLFRQPLTTYANTLIYYYPCNTPIAYKISSIDPRFNLTESELQVALGEAAGIWSDAQGKELFVFDQEKGELVIGLVYDSRQLLTSQISSKEEEVKNKQGTLNAQIAQYENQVADFKQRVAKLNQTIQSWNSQGGAPKEEFDKIVAEQQTLQTEAQTLNARASELNLSAQDYNLNVGDLNQTIDTFNSEIERRPEEGLYNPKDNTITIYFSNSREELVHTLAHELGHARGIGHLENEESIMFPLSTETTQLSSEDKVALEAVCRRRSLLEQLQEKIALLRIRFNTSQ